MLCEASAKEVPELEEPVCFELEAKTDKMKKLWNEVSFCNFFNICLFCLVPVCLRQLVLFVSVYRLTVVSFSISCCKLLPYRAISVSLSHQLCLYFI